MVTIEDRIRKLRVKTTLIKKYAPNGGLKKLKSYTELLTFIDNDINEMEELITSSKESLKRMQNEHSVTNEMTFGMLTMLDRIPTLKKVGDETKNIINESKNEAISIQKTLEQTKTL